MSETLERLKQAVETLDAAESRAGAHCPRCLAATTLRVEDARAAVIRFARELVAEEAFTV